MKIDVEGAEVKVLTGGQRVLARPDAPNILFEINPSALARMGTTVEALVNLLDHCDYDLRTVAEHEGYRNVLAMKQTTIQVPSST